MGLQGPDRTTNCQCQPEWQKWLPLRALREDDPLRRRPGPRPQRLAAASTTGSRTTPPHPNPSSLTLHNNVCPRFAHETRSMLCLEPAACAAAFLSPSLYLDLSLPIPGGRIVAVSPTSRGRTAPKTGLCGALWAVIKHSGPGNRRIRPFSCMPSLKNHRLLQGSTIVTYASITKKQPCPSSGPRRNPRLPQL